MITSNYLSWDVTQFMNEYGDEIEMDIIRYSNDIKSPSTSATKNHHTETSPPQPHTPEAKNMQPKKP
jgi:hypothetical protein